VAEDKKTQLGQTPGRTHRPTGSQQPVAASVTPAPASQPPAVHSYDQTPPAGVPKTSYIPDTTDPLLGNMMAGRYLIEKKLGEGGMGAVYLATHAVLEKQVALKVLHGEFARKPDLVTRFMQEAKAASRIRHENVIDISDFGSTPEGLVFFAMELLKGHDLHEEIARARIAAHLLPWSRTKKIFLQICSALSAAHAKGIVHRDLKPENVFLVEFLGDGDFVKLLDFGIAKLTEESGEGGRKLTKTGMLFGTPEYMSPEQARGDTVDARVDVYAMGCILFQLCTNRVPFEAENFMGVLSLHLTEPPPTIAPEVFDQIGAPRALGDVIARALEKDRNARWQTIDELANAVREVCGDPIPADRSSPIKLPSSVPAPAVTTTSMPRAQTNNEARSKTAWTGNLRVPEIAVEGDRAPAKSKMPLIAGAVLVAGGAIAAAVVMSSHGGSSPAAPPAAAVTAPVGSAAAPAPPPEPNTVTPPQPVLPAMAELALDSTPQGAAVIDLSTNRAIGRTPVTFKIRGTHDPRQFQFHKSGYKDSTVELVPDQDKITYTQPLVKGVGATAVHSVVDPGVTPPTGVAPPATGSGAPGPMTRPETGPGPTTKPDTGATGKPPEVGSAGKPPEVKPEPPKPPDTKPEPPKPPDDGEPHLKGFGSAGTGP
jgi:serine/threonine-protein kinase